MRTMVLVVLASSIASVAGEPVAWGDAGVVEPQSIKVGLGGIRELRIAGVRKVSVGSADVLAAKVLENGRVMLVGAGPGKTLLTVWVAELGRFEFLVTVLHDYGVGLAADLRKLLEGVDGVIVRHVGDRLFIEGTTYEVEDADRVAAVAAARAGVVVNWASRGSPSLRSQAERLDGLLAKAGFPATHVVFVGDSFALDGVVPPDAARAKAEAVVRAGLEAEKLGR